ncbi:hypothetical protein CISIN_1g042629mg [Citrus sinensis]|uniref:Uncharacterized protein n=1 Tax=Citrus sinensis TaxID=2711 RepID=A0A067DR85_CITSI|nr:hypothetical protein CISIN_1g042629mg [Citrus sinensis]
MVAQNGHALEVQVLARETIKPAYQTPPHLRNFRLSLIDQINFPISVSTIFLHKADDNSFLPKTLTKFYPFAGRVKDDFSIECKDEGAECVEALAIGFLFEYLRKPDQNLLRDFQSR